MYHFQNPFQHEDGYLTSSEPTLQYDTDPSPTPLPKSFSSSGSSIKQSPLPTTRSHPFIDNIINPFKANPPIMQSTPHSFVTPPQPISISIFPYHNHNDNHNQTPPSIPRSFTHNESPTPQPKSFSKRRQSPISSAMTHPQSFSLPKQKSAAPKPPTPPRPLSSLIKNGIFITKEPSDTLSPYQSPPQSPSPSPALMDNTESDSYSQSDTSQSSDSEIEILNDKNSREPTPKPISFSSNNSKKRSNRNYESEYTPTTKKRKLNANTQITKLNTIDLCEDSSDEDEAMKSYAHIDNPKTIKMIHDIYNNANNSQSDIDIEDKEVMLFGISIGTHSHHWIPNSGNANQRPRIIFNKYKKSMDIYLNSTSNEYVKVIIDASNIANLVIPKNPSYFNTQDSVGQYINVLFLLLKTPLVNYGWLEEHFCPKNQYYDAKCHRQTFISIYIDAASLDQLQSIILDKRLCSLLDRFTIMNNENKCEFLKAAPMNKDIYGRWKQINEEKTCACIYASSENESENENENANENDKIENDIEEEIDIISNNKCEDDGEDSDSASSLSSKFEFENTENNNNNNKEILDYKLYIENNEFIKNPHHRNSFLYISKIKQEPYTMDEKCYWVFPEQHGHNNKIFAIKKSHFNILNNNKWLNDEIINFGMKYIYASWPSYNKKKVNIFTSYWYASISKAVKNKKRNKYDIIKQSKSFAIFDREYILIPICDGKHWELMIVYNHNIVFENRNNNDDDSQCYLIILDSLNRSQILHKSMFCKCKIWLNIMAESNGYDGKLFGSHNLITKCIKMPRQPNSIDCGCFLLQNVYQFGKEGGLDVNVNSLKNWYSVNDGVKYRNNILDVMKLLAKEQEKYVIEMYKRYRINENNRKKERAKRQNTFENAIECIE